MSSKVLKSTNITNKFLVMPQIVIQNPMRWFGSQCCQSQSFKNRELQQYAAAAWAGLGGRQKEIERELGVLENAHGNWSNRKPHQNSSHTATQRQVDTE
jgi:hypothetical protein